MISSINHHLSILRLRVHPQYLAHIAAGGGVVDPEWHLLDMQRSPWYDLLVPRDRLLAMRGVWGVMGFLMRDTGREG